MIHETAHYKTRVQQRAISQLIIAVNDIYGKESIDFDVTFTTTRGGRKARKKIVRDLRRTLAFFESGRDIFEIESNDGAKITIGHHVSKRKDCLYRFRKRMKRKELNQLDQYPIGPCP